jgi:hypothetical protein
MDCFLQTFALPIIIRMKIFRHMIEYIQERQDDYPNHSMPTEGVQQRFKKIFTIRSTDDSAYMASVVDFVEPEALKAK